MFDSETVAFLQSGCALIVGTVGNDGEPYAARAWGATILSEDDRTLRLVLDADDPVSLAHLAGGGAVAITATDVRTLRSMQLKGRCVAIDPATEGDLLKAEQYRSDFFRDIVETDHTDPALPPRLTPSGYVACVVVIDELFDQTPGPTAGTRLDRTS